MMGKLFGRLRCRLLSSYLPFFHCHSQAESSSLDRYIKRLQKTWSARDLVCRYYQLDIQMYKHNLAIEASECPGNLHVLATPLLDVLRVTVQTKSSDHSVRERPPLKIYGTIQLIDRQNVTYEVYRREASNPETVSHGSNLSLTRLDGTSSSLFLPCVSSLKMQVHLRDAAAEGKDIAKGDFDVQLVDKSCYHDKIVTRVVDGHGASASIQYATLPYAVIAQVMLSLTKNDETDSDQSHAVIYGTISASSMVKEGSISNVLFNRSPSEPMMVDLAAPIKLSRDMLAVPAYSCLQIKTDLWDHHTNQQIASDVIVADFYADVGGCAKQKLHLGQNYHIEVTLYWTHAYQYVFLNSGYAFDGQKLLCGQLRSLASYSLAPYSKLELPTSYPPIKHFGWTFYEVFSISITLNNDAITRLCGTIKVRDSNINGRNCYCIFERSNSNPEILDGDMKIKSLKWPANLFEGEYFYMHLHLTDDVGREVCKGCVSWDVHVARAPISWCDKRVSSVIRGQHGYATVHHAFFDRTIIAKVKAVFIPNRSFDVPFKISGDIVARYSNFIYSTYSEKMFFQSTLFGDNHHIVAPGGSQLVLQKSVVPVPYGSSLIIDVKLHAQAMCESSQGTRLENFGSLDKVVNFDVHIHETCFRRIEGDDFVVDVFVEWISG